MIRLAITGLLHETNTFSGVEATLDSYLATGWHTGSDMVEHYRSSHAVVGGFLQESSDTAAGSADADVDILPLGVGFVTPCGPISAEAYSTLLERICDDLEDAGPVDAVLLVLHGAAVANGELSADADIAERVRAVVGPDVPIGSVLDMHANVEQRLVDAVDVLLAYQTNPHIDARIVGAECRARVLDIVRTGARPAIVLEPLPLVVTIVQQDTSTEPMAGLLRYAREVESEPGMLDVSILEGFPYADTAQMGMSVLATHPDRDVAADAARRVASAVWDRRAELQGAGRPVSDVVTVIDAHRGEKPLLVLDVGDNVGGGGPGDSTVLLAEVLRRRVAGVGITLFDPLVVAALQGTPVGGRVDIPAGGRSAEQDGEQVQLTGVITGRHVGQYSEPKIAHGGFQFFDGGEMVGIRTDDGVSVVLTSIVVQPISPTQYRVVGIEPEQLRAVIGKGVNGPRAGYSEICEGLVVADTPGVTRNSVIGFSYRNRREPMYPFEPETRYRSNSAV
ncbi:M81 family metallopeptidase [Nakamurella lactea]|uniref:M81 family metallopeptidase n=1 Tax=Nakamurella lactea TaxID=459515 RepID=UPI000402F736|nr:M81 family metallopeptidase [Nakamurella lactea]